MTKDRELFDASWLSDDGFTDASFDELGAALTILCASILEVVPQPTVIALAVTCCAKSANVATRGPERFRLQFARAPQIIDEFMKLVFECSRTGDEDAGT